MRASFYSVGKELWPLLSCGRYVLRRKFLHTFLSCSL